MQNIKNHNLIIDCKEQMITSQEGGFFKPRILSFALFSLELIINY